MRSPHPAFHFLAERNRGLAVLAARAFGQIDFHVNTIGAARQVDPTGTRSVSIPTPCRVSQRVVCATAGYGNEAGYHFADAYAVYHELKRLPCQDLPRCR